MCSRLWLCQLKTVPTNIYGSFRVLFGYAFFFGLMPFWCDERNRQLRCCALSYMNVIVRMLVYQSTFLYNTFYEQSLVSHFFTTHVSQVTDNFEKINGMSAILITLCLNLYKRRYLVRLMEYCDSIEVLFMEVGVNFNHTISALHINRVILLMSFINMSYMAISVVGLFWRNSVHLSISMATCFFSPQVIACGGVIMFYGFTYKLAEYFNAINAVLKNLSHQWDTRTHKMLAHKHRSLQCLDSFSMYNIVTKNPSDIIQESMEIHYLICEAASTANKYFTYQLLTIISIAFLIIVFDAYYVLETLLGKSRRESKFKTVEFVTFFSCQMILYLIAIVSIVEGSNRAIKKSEKTGSIVHSLLNKAKTAEIKEKLQQFSMQLTHLKINFTAAGLFNIDRTLYFTISGALTTYLIILLQFTSNPPTSLAPNTFDEVTTATTTFINSTNNSTND